jgi:signal transduction histidine kinase
VEAGNAASTEFSNDNNQYYLGMGFYTVRLIAELHDGYAWMMSETEGVYFTITLLNTGL